MSISFTNGIEGVKARDYSVFIREAEYELSGGFGNIITIDCPSIPILTEQVDLDFLTGFDLDIHRTLTPLGGALDNGDLNKTILQPRVSINSIITYDDEAQPNDYFMIKVFTDASGIGSSTLTINLGAETFVLNGLGYFKFSYNKYNKWIIEQVGFHAIGEMTKDSINPKIENGLTVESNLNDTIILDKTATFSFNLANLVVDNITQMEALDKKKVEFLLLSSDRKQLYWFKPIVFNYSEDFKSGQVSTLPITLTKKINDVGEFREVRDVGSLT